MSHRVLVVDPCPDNARSLSLLLRSWGYEVSAAPDGPSALVAIRVFRPRAVLVEVALPELDGWEVARRVRAWGGDRPLLVALTVHGREQDRDRSREAGFDAHLTKPANLTELRLLLEAGAPAGVA